jgi:hypothetical protein
LFEFPCQTPATNIGSILESCKFLNQGKKGEKS